MNKPCDWSVVGHCQCDLCVAWWEDQAPTIELLARELEEREAKNAEQEEE